MSCSVEFFDDPATFLEGAREWLAADPLGSTIVTTTTERLRGQIASGEDPAAELPHLWFATLAEKGRLVGVAMRNAAFAPHPPYLLAMPDAAAEALADALLERGEEVGQVSGARPAVDVFAARLAAATGREVELRMHTTLYELGDLIEPRPASGALRRARPEEAEEIRAWHGRFFREAEEQAARDPDDAPSPDFIRTEDLRHRIAAGEVWLWEDGGRPVQLTTLTEPAYGVVRITLVSTPAEHRGHGYAAAAVAEVCRRLRARDLRVCLDADVENTVSTAVYQRLGFEPRADHATLWIR